MIIKKILYFFLLSPWIMLSLRANSVQDWPPGASHKTIIDTLYNNGSNRQIIAVKQSDSTLVYDFYRQSGECVSAIWEKRLSFSYELQDLNAFLNKRLNEMYGEEREELGLWAWFVILFNQNHEIEEIVVLEPYPPCYEEQFSLIRQVLKESASYWEKPSIGNNLYYFTIGRCHVY